MWPPAAGPVAIPRQTLSHIDCTFGAVAACWPTAEALVALLILFIGPQGNWAFFTFGVIVFGASTIYNTLSYFNIALTLGRGKYKVLPEAMYASIF